MPAGHPALRVIVCPCGKMVSGHFAKTRRWCSRECYEKRPKRDRKLNTCKSCGAKCERAFCGVDCHNVFQSRNKVTYTCKSCGNDFKKSASIASNHGYEPLYCGLKCRDACPEWKWKAVIQGNLVQQRRQGPNKLEVRGSEILDGLGVKHNTQWLIADRFTVDVFVEPNIVIQWDGGYWHGYRAEGDMRPLDARQVRRVTYDRTQDEYLRSHGYQVFRFWEHEVWKQEEKVRETIRNAVRSTLAGSPTVVST